MSGPLRLLGIFAHPDDESLGCGGTFAKAAAEGIETYLITATLGERGRIGNERPGPQVVAPVRDRELRAAAARLGIREVVVLDYPDGALADVEPGAATARIAAEIRRLRPQVVVTFDACGAYGHPDHIAISQLTGAAVAAAASGGGGPHPAHQVDKLYWMAWDHATLEIYQRSIGTELGSVVDGVRRSVTPWQEWAVTTRVDAGEHWQTVWSAVQCHQSQITGYGGIGQLGPEEHRRLWGNQSFYRVYSLVNGGGAVETDLFAGLR